MLQKFFKDIFNKGNLKDYFKRNRIFILFATVILILSLLSGFYSSSTYTYLAGSMMGQVSTIAPLNNNVSDNMMVLFANNFLSDIYIVGMGLLLSIPSIIKTVLNGVLVGYIFSTQNFMKAFVSISFHGIFELLALIFSLTGAFLVTKMEIRIISAIISRKKFDKALLRLKTPVKDLILSLVIVIILLIVAALVEATLTPYLIHMFGF